MPFSKKQKNSLSLELLFFIFITLILYLRVTGFDFVWDDDLLIRNNPYFQQTFHLKEIFGGGLWKFSMGGDYENYFYYRPVVTFFYFMEYKLWGFSSTAFHSVNLFLHLFSLSLIWLLMIRLELNRMARMLGMLFYSLHPALVSCVAFISCHGDLLCQIFGLLALLFWMMKGKIKWLSLLFIFLAMLSKEAGVVLPIVIILLDVLICNRPIKNIEKFYSVLLWVPYFIMRQLGKDGSVVLHSSWEKILENQGAYRTFAYISRIFFPVPTSQIGILDPVSVIQNIGMMFGFLLMLGLLYYRSDKKQKFLIGWFFLSTVIVADWANLGVRFSDQLLYLPLVSFSILFGIIISQQARVVYFSIPLFVLFGLISNNQIPVWKNSLVFWKNELKYNPKDHGVNMNYAATLIGSGNRQEGCEWMYYALDGLDQKFKNHDYALINYNLGNCFLNVQPDVAEKYYQEALRISDKFSMARHNLVLTLLAQKKLNEALKQVKVVVEQKPTIANSWILLSNVLFVINDKKGCLEALHKAMLIDPQNEQIDIMKKKCSSDQNK